MRVLLFLLLFIFGCSKSDGQFVIAVTDGDTIKVLVNKEEIKVRLSDIDCPERKQPFGTKAKQFTSSLVFGKKVIVKEVGKDRWGRLIGEVILPDGKILNRELVRFGYAWWYKDYSKDESYGRLEAEAREAKLGLWADKNPIPPWEFRRKK